MVGRQDLRVEEEGEIWPRNGEKSLNYFLPPPPRLFSKERKVDRTREGEDTNKKVGFSFMLPSPSSPPFPPPPPPFPSFSCQYGGMRERGESRERVAGLVG